MRLTLAWLSCWLSVYSHLLVQAQDQQQQIIVGLTGAKVSGSSRVRLNDPAIARNGLYRAKIAHPTTSSSSAAQALHSQAVSLLSVITAHAPVSTVTSSSSPSNSLPTRVLDFLDITLDISLISAVRHFTRAVLDPFSHFRLERVRETVRRYFARLISSGSKATEHAQETAMARLERLRSGSSSSTAKGTNVPWSQEDIAVGMEEVLKLAGEAAEAGNGESFVLIGDLHLTGHLTLPASPKLAFEAYTKASERMGNAEAQYKLGFLYGTNLGGVVGGEEGLGKQGSALLHYTFAALASHVPATMTVGYRHWVGIGTKQSCSDALGWYKSAADQAMRTFNEGPPGGRHLPPTKVRLSDLKGGAYGPGASSSSRAQSGSSPQTQQDWEDLLEFYHFHADRGDPSFMFRLGRLYYQGFGGSGIGAMRSTKSRLNVGMNAVKDGLGDGGRDFNRALKWFGRIAKTVWPKDPREATTMAPATSKMTSASKVASYDATKDVKVKTDDHFTILAGISAGFLGRMYLRGEGVRQDYNKAFLWYMRGNSQGDHESQNGLGIMYRDGLGVHRDLVKAKALFASASQDVADASVNLGKLAFALDDYPTAMGHFELAIRQGDIFQSFYYLAELHALTTNRPDQCPTAVSFYKMVSERGDWAHEVWWEAERALERGEDRVALLGYWIMAERGYEVAQNNVAWILDRDKKRLRLPILDVPALSNQSDRVALTYWTRSAAQDNVDALLKMGDYYYAGFGADEPLLEKAAACYQSAAGSHISAMAMWNLGWMHETGQGVAQDYHLAKRYYDLALTTSADAYLPVKLSLISLWTRSLYHQIFAATDDLKTLSLFSKPVPPPSPFPDTTSSTVPPPPQNSWSFGRAWREMKRRWGVILSGEGLEDELDEQQGTNAGRREESERAMEDPTLEWARRGRDEGRDGDDEDEFWLPDDEGELGGTLAIIALFAALAWLLYFRGNQDGPDLRRPAAAVAIPGQAAPEVPAGAPPAPRPQRGIDEENAEVPDGQF